jgi:hypothetical protein
VKILKFNNYPVLPRWPRNRGDGPDRGQSRWNHADLRTLGMGKKFVIFDIGVKMTAELILFDRYRPIETEPVDAIDRLFAALGQYSSAELLELLYVGQEPGIFELMRGLFALPEESRLTLQRFLSTAAARTSASVDPDGRLVLQRRRPE